MWQPTDLDSILVLITKTDQWLLICGSIWKKRQRYVYMREKQKGYVGPNPRCECWCAFHFFQTEDRANTFLNVSDLGDRVDVTVFINSRAEKLWVSAAHGQTDEQKEGVADGAVQCSGKSQTFYSVWPLCTLQVEMVTAPSFSFLFDTELRVSSGLFLAF